MVRPAASDGLDGLPQVGLRLDRIGRVALVVEHRLALVGHVVHLLAAVRLVGPGCFGRDLLGHDGGHGDLPCLGDRGAPGCGRCGFSGRPLTAGRIDERLDDTGRGREVDRVNLQVLACHRRLAVDVDHAGLAEEVAVDAHAFQSGRSAVGRLDERGDIASWRGVVPAGFVTGRPVRLLGGAKHGGNDQMRVVPCRMVRPHGDRQAVGVGDARLHALHGPADQLLGVQAVVE